MSGEYFVVAGNGGGSVACINSNNVVCSSSRWLTEEVFKLIDMVQRDEAIYNPRHKYYFCRPYVENFWREVDLKLEKNPGASLAKWTNLRISFRREYTNYLEEKVPPCWSYFDRMFFLHPYLRKKHQPAKSLDSQVQDALVQISSLSSRLQRERAVAAAASAAASLNSSARNYLEEYFDDGEQNNSELDEIIEEEQQSRFVQQLDEVHSSLQNDIKSECEEDYDVAVTAVGEDETINPSSSSRHVEDDVEESTADETDMRDFVLNSLATTTATAGQSSADKRAQHGHNVRLQHLNRLQTRSYHDELRAKRPRSQESISGGSSSQAHLSTGMVAGTAAQQQQQRLFCASTPAHSNVSFVRPTFAKPAETVSTTTTSNSGINPSSSSSHAPSPSARDNIELTLNSTTSSSALQQQQSRHVLHPHPHSQSHSHTHHPHAHNRLEIASVVSAQHSSTSAGIANRDSATQPPPHVELCDCKTDPDAMFLMSLLPDIQKLNGRDRGKIKIAFQNILQDYLYPD